MTDIVERLRHATNYGSPNTTQLLTEAADEIERLTAERDVWKIACNAQADEVKRLRALRKG